MKLTLLRDGSRVFPAMLDAIAAASREVLLEMYWLDDSPVAQKVLGAMAERARAGVTVRVLYDAIGSLGASDTRFDALIRSGGQVVEFNPIAPWRRRFRLRWIEQRDHRKILVIDGAVAFIGGLNIGLPWMPREEGGGGWRDDVARIEGPAAEKARTLFYETWRQQGGACPGDVTWTPHKPFRETARDALHAASLGRGEVEVLGHDAWSARMLIRRRYLSHIRRATQRILIANSYFLPDGAVRRGLEKAARRGVEVRVIVPRESDVPAVAWATRALYTRLLKAGVHVHEWLGPVLHAKTALIDAWATTGSYNMDARSWRYNLEANVATDDPDFVAQVERSLREDLEGSEEVDLAQWQRRPWSERLREWWFYLFRKTL